ncbi:MAG: hypothetical protein BZ151_03360 [Desulfobacca sp. 4484_104]|nr:MAG: hypothetical protein BZ151_03360 [Desulfobacca sp. 4484_104]RLA90907.1 MAG: hypothetical protein DRG58_00935 [Deltaproteobacteria bacterium]
MKNHAARSEPAILIQHSLVLDQVILSEHPANWPCPLSLALGLKEFLLLEGLELAAAPQLLSLAASLQFPVRGRVWLWGLDIARAARDDLYQQRRRLAYLAPGQVLLHRLTLLENITLPGRYFQQRNMSEIIKDNSELIETLGLTPYFSCYPPELPADIYFRGLWARAFLVEPELILAAPGAGPTIPENNRLILMLLRDYREQQRGAVVLTGPGLETFRSLADRYLRLEAGGLIEIRVPGQTAPPLIPDLPLWNSGKQR